MADDTKERMLRHVQFLALGVLVEQLLAAHFLRDKTPGNAADSMLRLAEALSDEMTFPNEPPEWSDLAAQEFRDALVRHIHRAKALATGEPFDPGAFRKRAPEPGQED